MVKKKSETKVCKHCQTEIPHSAKICPNCKKRVKGGKVKWIALIAVVLIAVILMLNSGNNYNDGSDYDEMNLVAEAEYPKLFSDIGAYRDRSVDLYGKVFNVLDSEDGVVFQIYVDSDYHNSVMVYYSRDFSVKEDEYVLVKGVVTDTYEGENLLGGTVVCPLVSASIVEQSSYIDAFSRTLKVVETSNAEWSKDRLTVKIDKVEFAKNETRLYVTASNEGEKTASVYSYSSVLIQNGKQYELTYNYDAEYDELQDEIKAGASDSGILSYPAVEQTDFDFVFSAEGADYYTDEVISVSVE